jgi:hypothetical protein
MRRPVSRSARKLNPNRAFTPHGKRTRKQLPTGIGLDHGRRGGDVVAQAAQSSTAMSVPERVGELDRRDPDVNLPLIWSISGLSVIQE